ncbi:hypothetical protein EV143_11824 [Flavobacterium chryseum]|uniref:hypothetical protein n=1 Tax=Flavobacterium sp. P3160 TaxID=2512113 RepID=UPI00105B79FA|nr:hypothetical protein [Flavobacterium sp. P3160]TDO68840.1 hypothetical protein EV143_11824 [Flavobacterium sp. P3160]
MKPIRSLFLIAIGMMVFTATATTAKLEQKQKTELVKEFSLPTNEVSVEKENPAVSFILIDTQTQSIKAQALKVSNEPESLYAIIKDVGWRSQKGNTTTKTLKEKFPDNLNKESVNLIHRENTKTKDNCKIDSIYQKPF